jgi:hypothetical protein
MSVCDKMTVEEKEGIMSKNRKRTVEAAVATCGWGFFFIWTGIALFAHVGWGTGLLGVGIITLGAQVARKHFGLKLEGFWVVVGSFFVLGGVWRLLNVQLRLVPILCFVVGFALLVSVFVCMPKDQSGYPNRTMPEATEERL